MDIYRILTPSEYEALRAAIPKTSSRILIETMMFTGMRYSELLYTSKHLSIIDFKNRAITLPAVATKTNKSRSIHLTPAFAKDLEMYLKEFKKLNFPGHRTMERNLKRWWLIIVEKYLNDSTGHPLPADWYPTPKTFRKSWESWLLKAGFKSFEIALSQGHSELISYGYYANLDPRLKSEVDAVLRYTQGWGL